ncbi:FAD-dependent oxidoreductase [Streptomyces sp. NPDC052107]|uniref:FAD-dependent oxidoreductase n=1 Tax=Streptomyces sp. NPDC052107 TaxID=3155632 RepID=UPI003428E71C
MATTASRFDLAVIGSGSAAFAAAIAATNRGKRVVMVEPAPLAARASTSAACRPRLCWPPPRPDTAPQRPAAFPGWPRLTSGSASVI